MAIRDLLVHMDTQNEDACLELAAGLARQHGATVTGLYAIDIPVLPNSVAVEMPSEVVDAHERSYFERAERAQEKFQAFFASMQVPAVWRAEQGRPAELLSTSGHAYDLLLVAQASPGVADQVLLTSGRPILLVPESATTDFTPKKVTVAWTETREAARALDDGLDLLKAATEVALLTLTEKSGLDERTRTGLSAMVNHLKHHDIEATPAPMLKNGHGVGPQILAEAKARGSDLLVMGGYGHSRLREIIVGGATAHVIKHTTIPTLLSH